MAVTRDSSAKAVAVGQKIEFPIVPSAGLRDVKPSSTSPDVAGEEIQSKVLEITKSKAGDIVWTGNEQQALGDKMYDAILEDQITERMRAIVNEVEHDIMNTIFAECKANVEHDADAFKADLTAFTKGLKTLQDKGAPRSNLQAVLNTTAAMNLRNQNQLQKVNESGSSSLLRQGVLGNIMGFDVRETGSMIATSSPVGSTKYLVNGVAKKGDYVITVDTGNQSTDGVFVNAKFGSSDKHYPLAGKIEAGATEIKLLTPLQEDIADNTEITLEATTDKPSAMFPRSAIWLATRTVPEPAGGDSAVARRTITDPETGLSFGVSLYQGYKQNHIEISMSWGVGIIKPEFVYPVLG